MSKQLQRPYFPVAKTKKQLQSNLVKDALAMALPSNAVELARTLALRETVIFAGSGLSVWSGLPTWQALIEKLIEFVEGRTGSSQIAARRNLRDHDFLLSADHLIRKIKPIELVEFLRVDLGFAVARPSLVHALIQSLGPNCFITTNYDSLIETQFTLSGRPRLKPVTNRQLADFADIIRADAKDFIFKIHGSVDDAASLVLSETQYHEIILNSPSGRSVLEAIKIIMATRPVVFFGYGLKDLDLLLVLRFLQQAFDRNAGRYWAVIPDLDPEEADRLWETYRIRCATYPTENGGRDHAAFLELLRRLSTRTKSTDLHAVSDPSTTILSLARYGSALSKLDPGPGLEVQAYYLSSRVLRC